MRGLSTTKIQTTRQSRTQSLQAFWIQRFRSGVSVNKKKVLAIFKYLTGKESPIEAVELTVRRDQNLREARLKVAYEKVKPVEDPPTLVRKDCFFLSKFYYFSIFF